MTRARTSRDPRYVLLIGFAVGILVKLASNVSYVHLWHQGSWYFALPIDPGSEDEAIRTRLR